VERAPENLAGKIRDLDRARGLARAWITAVDWAEGEGPALAAGSLDVDQAVGAQLRRLARLVGAPEVADDDAQRALVRAQLLAIRSRGTGDDLLGVLDALWPGEGTLEEHFPAGQLLGSPHGVGADFAAVAGRLLARSRSAAVYTQLTYSPAPEAETFRLAPAWASPDAVLDDPGAAQLAQLDAAVQSGSPGATPTHAWFGALEDVVSAEVLVASGGALDGELAGSPARSVARLCLRYTGANDQYHQASAGVGELEDASDWGLVVVFWLPAPLVAGGYGLVGKQDLFSGGVAPFEGWNLFFPGGGGFGAGDLRLDLSPTVGASSALDAPAACRTGYNVAVASVDRTADVASLSVNGGAPLTLSTAGLSYVNAQPLTVGDSRVNRTNPAPLARVPVLALYDQVLDVQAVGAALLEALHGSAPSSSRGLSDEATQTQGGALSGVVVV
jgi:hypothetical protein